MERYGRVARVFKNDKCAIIKIVSMEEKKIKVVWLCYFSNPFVHKKLDLQHNPLIGLVKRLTHKPVSTEVPEFANWITNGIHEFENIDEVELHIVSPYPYLKRKTQEFEANGVYYHFFRSEDQSFIPFVYKQLFCPTVYPYKGNSRTISKIIRSINPEIVHLFGTENPIYSNGMLQLPDKIVTIAQLQTLLSDPDFKNNYPISGKDYENRVGIEKRIIRKADYVATPALKYRQIIHNEVYPQAIILNMGLMLKDPIVTETDVKLFDFVYFAANINKAADLAIEAFALAHQQKPEITLDIIGGFEAGYKQYLDDLIKKYGVTDAITFEGKLPTHEDVLKQIRKAKFALLPLKIDLTSGTIREAMSNGIPVITTDTGELGTQKLNLLRQNVLISSIGDHQALANNMLILHEDVELAEKLRQNGFLTSSERCSNKMMARKYVESYKACLEHNRNGKPLPAELIENLKS